jgi:hypothetical protein
MKTSIRNLKQNLRRGIFFIAVTALSLSAEIAAQDYDSMQTLFRSDVKITGLWTPEIKINSIQGDIGTLIGFYGGALINRTFLAGISGGVNLGHPRVNYGYFGGIVQYIFKPSKLIHASGQLLLAYGTTKDYENPKSGLFDNFWNISGASFFIMEPGINLEMNLSNRLTLVAGMSYRNVAGLNETNENVSITHVTNEELSGLNINIGLKIHKKPK